MNLKFFEVKTYAMLAGEQFGAAASIEMRVTYLANPLPSYS